MWPRSSAADSCPGVSYKDIKISTDVIPTEGGGTANVSSIEIYLTK
jgi:DNA-binding protein Alba